MENNIFNGDIKSAFYAQSTQNPICFNFITATIILPIL